MPSLKKFAEAIWHGFALANKSPSAQPPNRRWRFRGVILTKRVLNDVTPRGIERRFHFLALERKYPLHGSPRRGFCMVFFTPRMKIPSLRGLSQAFQHGFPTLSEMKRRERKARIVAGRFEVWSLK